MSRGILGVKKDPKNQMLFSFCVRRGEEWPSSDSADSDFVPSEDEAEVTQHAQREKRKKLMKKKVIGHVGRASDAGHKRPSKENPHDQSSPKLPSAKKVRVHHGGAGKYTHGEDLWGHRLPVEILLKIFGFVVQNSGALPFLCRAGRVCSLWHSTSHHPCLWQKVDLSYGWIKAEDSTLKWLCQHRFSKLKDIDLSLWKKLTPSGLKMLADSCPTLQTINLSYCIKVQGVDVRNLLDSCPNLSSIDLSSASADAVSRATLKHLVESSSTNLCQLNLSGNTLKGFNIVLNLIADSCPNLDLLNISNVIFSADLMTFNIERMQSGCPKLRVLRLANCAFRAPHAASILRAESAGFPELEEASLAVLMTNAGTGLDDNFLHRLLKTSTKLKLLDLRGSGHINGRAIHELAATDLQHLYISKSSICKYTGLEIIMQKWQHSLQELDLSWNIFPGVCLDLAMKKLAEDADKSSLQILNLAGTSISCDRVQSLLEGCPKLTILNLVSCRSLPRGMKREHHGDDLRRLRQNISSLDSDSS